MNKKTMLVVGGNLNYFTPFEFIYNYSTDEAEFLKHPKKFDLVLFTGGEDVSPSLYKEVPRTNMVYSNIGRDRREATIFNTAKVNRIKMAGICRGVQFLNVMHGGRMMHDIKGHCTINVNNEPGHIMKSHSCKAIVTNSYHHQACIPSKDAYVIGWVNNNNLLKLYGNYGVEFKMLPKIIVEALLFHETMSYGVQYHPEMMSITTEGFMWFQELIYDVATLKSKKILLVRWTYLGYDHKSDNKNNLVTASKNSV
jgi:gamma-glutamyl-gamma-aminobutyrate hydrolase PuuD